MSDYIEPSDTDIHASPESVQDYIKNLEAKVRELEGWLDIAWNGLEEAGYQDFDIGLKEFMEDSSDG